MTQFTEKLDLTKIPFPQSIIVTKRKLDQMQSGKLEIITDSNISKDKISEFITKYGWNATHIPYEEKYLITAEK